MNYYCDISLLPDSEVGLGFLWSKVFMQVHLALVEHSTVENKSLVAVSFPEYGESKFPLGKKMRLLSTEQDQLNDLNVRDWLLRFEDYTHCTSIKPVPSNVEEYAYFKRKHLKTNAERLARRRAKRKNESFEDALKHYSNFKDQKSKLPYINLNSLSKSERFKVFIERIPKSEATIGTFGCYGLSSSATVPIF